MKKKQEKEEEEEKFSIYGTLRRKAKRRMTLKEVEERKSDSVLRVHHFY